VEKIQVPSNCPSCNSILEWVNDLLFCKNKDCSTKSAKKIQHFAKTLYIKGLGPRSIEKLGLNSAIDLYYLDKESASLALNSEKLGSKLIREIENSTTAPANLLLPAFSIPLVGRSAAEKLSVVCRSIFDITAESCKKAGLGPITTDNLMAWLDTDFLTYREFLPHDMLFEQKGIVNPSWYICLSGKLSSYKTKAEATTVLKSLGYVVKESVTNDVTILVNETGIETTKTLKALDKGIQIVTNLKDYIGERHGSSQVE
jgi:DNA ligase (NAD+)|tara:strand:+ start:1490 stop:2263 length:774 start_codon:yes stop_codon:yes gene_type:complete